MRAAAALLLTTILLAGCAGPDEAPATVAPPSAQPVATTTTPPVASTPAPRPDPTLVENGTLPETPIPAGRTLEFRFPLNATDRVLVNLVFGALQKPAPYGWSAQVSLRGPDGRIHADSGTSMPEGGAGFQLKLGGLNRTAEEGPADFLVRVRTSHPTTMSARAYLDEAAGPR